MKIELVHDFFQAILSFDHRAQRSKHMYHPYLCDSLHFVPHFLIVPYIDLIRSYLTVFQPSFSPMENARRQPRSILFETFQFSIMQKLLS